MRQVLVIWLLLAVPMQGVAVPHAHEGEVVEHQQRGHVHLGWGGGHQHLVGIEEQGDSGQEGADTGEHDDDAVYTPGEWGLSLSAGVQMLAGSGVVLWQDGTQTGGSEGRVRGPDVAFGGVTDRPIYLRTLSLRL